MHNIEIGRGSAWDRVQIERFLATSVTPIRLALEGSTGKLMIVALWFEADAGALWCASHRTSALVRSLAQPMQCAFDISTNDMPYRGVRGRASVHARPERGAATLNRLIQRYLGNDTSRLARWLLSRSADEVALEVRPSWMTAWDFGARMDDIPSRQPS